MKYLIIGNSAAAVGAVEAIRKKDNKGEITILSKEPYLAYSRPLITEFLADLVTEKGMSYRAEDFYKGNNVSLKLGVSAKSIDAKNKIVSASDKNEYAYDKLLIATGGSPIFPPMKGSDKKGVFTLMTLNESKEIKKNLKGVKKAVVIGGGLIGMKAAEGLHEAGIKVTIVELADRILSRILDEKGSRIFESYLKEKGMGIITSDSVVEITGAKKVAGAKLKSKKKIACDILIMAIGVRPNLDVIKGTGIEAKQGIIVDNKMQTNIADIYAAGDVVQADDMLSGEKRVNAIWPLAYKQGRIAGANMAGGNKSYEGGFAQNSLTVLGLSTISMGIVDPPSKNGYEVITGRGKGKYSYKKFVFDKDTIIGGIFIEDIDRSGIITGLVKERYKVADNKEQFLSEKFGLINLDRQWRDNKLTKPV